MLCVLPFFSGDVQQALDLMQFIHDLGGVKSHSCLLVADAATPWDKCRDLQRLAARCFKDVSAVNNVQSVKGWIPGSNSLFKTAAVRCAGQPFFWLEPDAVPLRAPWLDEIEEAYRTCGQPFMGALISHKTPNWPSPYLEGCAVYPPDAWARMSATFDPKKSWTMACASVVVPNAVNTPLIHHAWGRTRDGSPTADPAAPDGPNKVTLERIRPGAALFHRIKDGSLIKLLREKYALPLPQQHDRPKLVVVFPFCEKDGAEFVRTVEWMWELKESYPYEAVLSYDMATPPGCVRKMKETVECCFQRVYQTAYPSPRRGDWPPSTAFRHAAQFMQKLGRPWFWLEYDMIPLKPNWLEAMDAEYRACGKPFMGPVVPGMGHMNGTGIYPPNAAMLLRGALSQVGTAWDTAAKAEMTGKVHDCSRLLHHAWVMRGGKFFASGVGQEPSFVDQRMVGEIRPSAVLFHRCKDGTLIERLRERNLVNA